MVVVPTDDMSADGENNHPRDPQHNGVRQEEMKDETKDHRPSAVPLVNGKPHSRGHIDEIAVPLDPETRLTLGFFGVQSALVAMVQAAWSLVLSKYSDNEDIAFRYLQPLPNTRQTLMYVCKASLCELETVESVIQHFESGFIAAHAALPRTSGVVQPSEANSSFKSIVVFFEGSQNEARDLENFVSKSDFAVVVTQDGKEVSIKIRCDSLDVYDEFATNVAHTLGRALALTVNREHGKRTDDIDLLSTLDRDQIEQWNREIPRAVNACIHELFHQQAEAYPSSTALSSWDGSFTYLELDLVTDRLSKHLCKLGVAQGSLVLLCFEKSIWMTVSMISVLKAGGVAVPLDASYPSERLLDIAKDTGATVVLSGQQSSHIFVDHVSNVLSDIPTLIERLSGDNNVVPGTVQPTDPAFVLFTSGSTGKPKGLVHTHSTICSSVAAYAPALNLTARSRVLQFSAYSFDISVIDTIATLIQGACICVPSEHERLNDITGYIQRSRASWAFLTPSFARLINSEHVPTLTDLVLGGEDVPQDTVQTWASRTRRVMNGYGPAECTICVAETLNPNERPIIGRGIGCLTWVTEPANHSRLAPLGCVGELLIEGPIVFQGYLNDEEKTNSAFLDNPTWLSGRVKGRRRLYKTGDMVRYNPDGTLVYVGRRDSQVKLRGQRIELGEVEYHIRSHVSPNMDVAVEIVNLAKSGPVLAAFVSMDDTSMSIRALARRVVKNLDRTLPTYMVPSTFIPVRRLPMSHSNKIDRQKLRIVASKLSVEQVASYMDTKREKQTLSTALERRLAALWTKVLNIDSSVEASDHFLVLGGDSLAAIALVSAARQDGLRISVAEIFQRPFLSDMALALSPSKRTAHSCNPFEMLPLDKSAAIYGEALEQCRIPPAEIEDIFPCTPLQEGLFALSATQPGTYVAQMVYSIPEDVDRARLEAAWDSVIERNAVLRVRIVRAAFKTFQVVARSHRSWQTATDLGRYLTFDKRKPMEYGQSLLRMAIITSEISQKLVLTIHHSIFDGWSLQLIWHEVEKLYMHESLPDTLGFNDFIHFLEYDSVSQGLSREYWRTQLDGAIAATFPSSPSATYRPQVNASFTHSFRLPQQQSDITLSIVIRGAWAMLLAQYSGSKDVTFGMTLSGRSAPFESIEGLIGPTIATVPVRVRIDPMASANAFLRDIQRQATEMMPYEHTGLQEIFKSSSDAQELCNFSSLLVIQPAADARNRGAPILFENEILTDLILPHALVVECHLTLDGINIAAGYDSTILRYDEVERLMSQFEHVLRQLCQGAIDVRLRDVELVSPADISDVLAWNGDLPPPEQFCIHERFELQALQRPSAEAVCAWDGTLSFRELDQLASRLARYFSIRGIGPEVVVPLCFDKSKWVIVSLLAVLKAGGACLYLEPRWPRQRIDFILESVKAAVVVAEPQYLSMFDDRVPTVLSISSAFFNRPAPVKSSLELPRVQPNHAAFVMFTSGSTGTPKGIVQEHVALYTSARNHASICNITSESRVLQFSAFTFDVYIIEICTTLTYGGCVCVPSESDRMNRLTEVMDEMRVNWAFFTPTFCRSMDPQQMPHLRTLLVGGEAVDKATIDKWVDHVLLLNCYGPAECGPSVMCEITPAHRPESIGYPLCVTSWIVDLDDHHKLAPVGAVGELLLEGYTMARGYLDEPEKTAKSFVSAPKWLDQAGPFRGRRLYKTGDLVRYTKNGALDFLGRKDTQVKVRGQRVELGEVEHHLRKSLPDTVDAAAETVRLSNSHGRTSLVAFLSPKNRGLDDEVRFLSEHTEEYRQLVLSTKNLQARMEESVPGSMVPSVVLFISKMPITSSGKLDRKQLKALASQVSSNRISQPKGTRTVPNSDMEKRLQALWEKLLNLDGPIYVEDHFFHLGADSITAMNLVALARSAGFLLSVGQIFKHPVLSEMASHLRAYEEGIEHADVVEFELLPPGDHLLQSIRSEVATSCQVDENLIEDIYPCTPLQEGLLALSMIRPGAYISQNIYFLPSSVDSLRFQAAWNLAIQQHFILRTRVLQTTYGVFQTLVARAIAWQTGDNFDAYIEADKQLPIYNGDPMVRLALFPNTVGTGSRFILTLHHSVYDGWSLNLLWKEVKKAYLGLRLTRSPPFNKFIKYILGSDMEESRTYWRNQLKGANSTNFPDIRPGIQPFATSFVTHPRICRLSPARPRSDVTLSTLIRAAWSLIVARYSLTDDITFGAIASGRTAPVNNVGSMVAPTITTVPIRILLNYQQLVSDFVDEVQAKAVEMLPFEHTGLQNIKRYLDPEAQGICELQSLLVIQPMLTEQEAFSEITCLTDGSDFAVPHALVLACSLVSDGVTLQASFDPRILEPGSVQRIMALLENLLIQISVSDPNMKLYDIDMLDQHGKQEILEANARVPETNHQCVHHIIQQRVIASPYSTAISSWEGQMTYESLDVMSARLSIYLQTLEVGPETIVPLLFEKSMWTMVALLGVLKAGGAFVLLDHSISEGRLKAIILAVDAKVALSSRKCLGQLQKLQLPVLVVVDESELDKHCARDSHSRFARVRANNIVYVNFTSGTTSAMPKAAVIEHSAYSTGAMEHAKAMGIDSSSRVLQFASYNFDGSILEMLTPLMHGGCVCIPSERDRFEDIAGFMNKADVNLAILTPRVARAAVNPSNLKSLHTLILVGERMSRDDVLRYTVPGLRLLNGYGLTECCVCSAISDTAVTDLASIGKAVGSHFWLTDPDNHDRLAPIGTVAELLIEGSILAREYLNDTTKTKASFITNPLWSKGIRAMRLYKTGDLVRYNPDGTLTLVGRKDMQVKLRGQRIDLSEVERLIKQGFRDDSVEVACDLISPADDRDTVALVAFVCFEGTLTGTDDHLIAVAPAPKERLAAAVGDLTAQLLAAIPSHMVPSFYIPVDQIPLMLSGKANRRELAEVAGVLTAHQLAAFTSTTLSERQRPSTRMEIRLSREWARILNIQLDLIRAHDSFFLWGDSISAIRLTAALRDVGLTLAAADILRHPVLSEMADLVQETGDRTVPTPLKPFVLLGGYGGSLFDDVMDQCAVGKDMIQDVYPCTPLQEGLMALSIKQRDSYVARNVLTLPASLDIDRFILAWEKLVDAHPILRTRIIQTESKGALQVVLKETISWSKGDNLALYLQQDRLETSHFGDTLNRFALIVEPAGSYFVWTSHHATYDGWSVDLIFRQVDGFYKNLHADELLPFNCYIEHLTTRNNDETDAFWRSQAANNSMTVFPVLPTSSYKPNADTSLTHKIDLPREGGLTSTSVHAAWAFISAQYAETDEVVFGVVMNGRTVPVHGIEKIVGPTITTVPLRVEVDMDQTVGALAQSIEKRCSEIAPFASKGLQNIKRLGPQAETLCNFQSILVIQPDSTVCLPCGTSSSPENPQDLSNFNNYGLMLEFSTGAETLSVTANFDKKLIERNLMNNILRQLCNIIKHFKNAELDTKLRDVDIATPEDIQEIWSKKSGLPNAHRTRVQDLFIAQVEVRPNEPAIRSWDGDLTYQQLHSLSSRLANYLVNNTNVKSETIVPLCFERSMWTVVSLLAVLKAGGAVILLDPANPLARLHDIVLEAGAETVLCDRKFATKIRTQKVLEITPGFMESLPDGTLLNSEVEPENMAFVLSTSGSTGKPKLMVHTHQAIATSILAYGKTLNLNAESRVLQFAAYAFDISINEMLATLFHGGCLCVPSENDRLNNVAGCISNMQVNWLFATPSFITHARILPEHIPSLKTLVLGGEVTSQDTLDDWKSKVNLLTAYGPAECQICTVGPLIEPRDIGYSSGCVCWITDQEDFNRLLPVGMVGELIVQGPIVARGYLNASETPFRFSPSWLPDCEKTLCNLYRTGDLVKCNSRGSMTYIGRKDDTQIKLRGQRLELGEVEHHLRKLLPKAVNVTAGIVNHDDHPMLVAFLSGPEANNVLTKQIATGYLEGKWALISSVLPSFMVPQGYVCLDSLPLTATGKTDRKRLQTVEISLEDLIVENSSERLTTAPSSRQEQILRSIWAGVLKVKLDMIVADSDFFGLGGDSILAIRLVSMSRARGMRLTVAEIFENPRLSEMARLSTVPVDEEDPAPFSMIEGMGTTILREAAEQCKIQSNQIEDIYPCTPLQEGLFALSQTAGAYVARSVFELPSTLDLATFKAAWERTSSLNAILRTAIVQTHANRLLQVVSKETIKWAVSFNLIKYLENDQVMRLGDSLTRFAIVDEKYFVLSQHHAAYDGSSLPQIFGQVEDIYQGITSAFRSAPYNRFVKHITKLNEKDAQDFWTREMAGASPSMLPAIAPDHQPSPSSYVRKELRLSPCNQAVTTSTLIRAAWALIVSTYSKAHDVTFGATLSGRQASVKDIEDMTGPTITTVPIRVDVNPDLQVDQYLQGIQEHAIKMIPYEQLGLQNIGKLSTEARAVCDLQNILIVNPEPRILPERNSVHVPYNGKIPNAANFRTYALNLDCTILDKSAVVVEAIFDPNVIDKIQMNRILGQFQHVLTQLSCPNFRKLKDIECVSPQDTQEITHWNARSTFTESMSCVHFLVDQQVKLQQDKPAICSWDGDLSYRKLEQLSAHLAYYLCSLGVGPEVNVPLCFEKSLWMVVAVLAVMKSGGCFVPLDPSHPKGRLIQIVDQLQAPVLLTSSHHSTLFSETFEVNDMTIARLPAPPTEYFSNKNVQPRNPLYIIFTSGSTGQPKGVVIEHQAFCAGSNARRQLLRLDHESRVLQFSSYSFDVSMEDILSTLVAGGCICMPSEEERMNDLAQAVNRMQVNFVNLTPSVASVLNPEDVPSMKVLALGGEPMTETHVQKWSSRLHLVNFYGPTECSVTTLINAGVAPQSHPKNIGRAVGCKSWIVEISNHNRLAPIGTTGELLIEGPVLARGYLHDNASTQNAFIENPDWAHAPKRLYKTGDLVRYESDGTVIYIGRVEETQIKLRGQRVELGEIEHHLRLSLPEAQSIAVDVLQHDSKQPALAAFMDPSASHKSIIERVSTHLQDKLPAHMVPNVFIEIEKIPLTSAGKLDRRELRRLGLETMSAGRAMFRNDTSAKGQEPSTDLERRMQLIWADILNIPASNISTTSAFFNLGGDSITAIQVVGRCRSQGIAVTTYDLLRHKTIANTCKAIEGNAKIQHRSESEESETEEDFELSPIQREHFQLMPDGNNLFQQSFLLRLLRRISQEAIANAIDTVISSHAMLRSRFSRAKEGTWMQRIVKESTGNHLFLTRPDGEVEDIRENLDRVIDIQKGPVLGACLIDSKDGQRLYLTAHHLVVDLVSWRILLHDLEEMLFDPHAKPAKEPLTFPTWCRLQAKHSHSRLGAGQMLPVTVPPPSHEYWGMKNSSNTYEETISQTFVLDEDSSALLLGKCNTPLRTEPVEIFLAAIFHSFKASFPDRGPPIIFNEGHGREPWDNALDLSRTIGWFTTMYPLIVEASEDMVKVVHRTKDARRSVPGKGWSYFTSRHLNDKSIGPVKPEIVFNYQGRYQQLERKDALLQLIPIESPSFARPGSNVQRPSLFEVSVAVHNSQISFDFVFSRHMLQQGRIQNWVQCCRESLYQAALRLPQMETRYTLSDFPLLPSDFKRFETLIDRISPQLTAKMEDMYPCSPMQRKMHYSQAGGSRCYEAVSVWKATPTQGGRYVDLGRLRKAWQRVVDQNSILRTCVMDVDHHVLQIVLEGYQADVVLLDETNEEPQPSLFDSLPLSSQAARPMHRMSFRQQSPGSVICKLEISHALIDGASMAILLQELASAYDSPSSSSQAELTYKDFIRHLQSDRPPSVIEHWKTYLKDATPCTFPTDILQFPSSFTSSRNITVDLSDLQLNLYPFCKQYSITLSTLIQTVWSLVLRLYTKQDNVSFGYLVSGRDIPLSGISQSIGPFFSLLCCQLRLKGDMTLLNVFEAVHADNVQNVRYQDFSLPEIEEIDGEVSELFNTLINFRKYAAGSDGENKGSIVFEPVEGYDPFDYDIVVGIAEHEQKASVVLTYWNSRTSDEQARAIAACFQNVLSHVLKEPLLQLSNLT